MEVSGKPNIREDVEDLEPLCRTGDSERTMATRGSRAQRNVCSGRHANPPLERSQETWVRCPWRLECSQQLYSWSPSTGRILRTVHSPTAGAHMSHTCHGGMLCEMVQTKRPDPTKPSAGSSGPDTWSLLVRCVARGQGCAPRVELWVVGPQVRGHLGSLLLTMGQLHLDEHWFVESASGRETNMHCRLLDNEDDVLRE